MTTKKNISLSEVAAYAQVSISTASLVLNNRGDEMRISESTQRKIKKAAAELGYMRPSPSASPAWDPEKLIKVAVFFINSFQDFPLDLFNKGISSYAAESPLSIDWVYHPFTPNHLKDYAALFSREHYDGIIITTPYEDDIRFLKENRPPISVVLYNCQINDYTCVCHDDYEIGKLAAEVFYRHKRQNIAAIMPQMCNKGINLRLAGFTNYLTDMGCQADQIRVATGPRKDIAGGYAAISKVFEQNFTPSAIYVVNDLMTGGVLNFLLQKRLRIPEDVEILSYGNVDAASLIPSVSSYVPKSDEMAYLCMKSLILELSGMTQPGLYYGFGTECIWRESCRNA